MFSSPRGYMRGGGRAESKPHRMRTGWIDRGILQAGEKERPTQVWTREGRRHLSRSRPGVEPKSPRPTPVPCDQDGRHSSQVATYI